MQVLLRSFTLTLLVFLQACGGGGSSGSGSSNTTPPPNTNAELGELTLSGVPLEQTFQASQLSYTASVKFLIHSTTVTPTTADANATATVNGSAVSSGTASEVIALSEGLTTITVAVTAEDGITANTYTVEVTRASADDFAQQAYIKASNAKRAINSGLQWRSRETRSRLAPPTPMQFMYLLVIMEYGIRKPT